MVVLIAVLFAMTASCRDAAIRLAARPGTARTATDQLFTALAARYTHLDREPKYDRARMRIAHDALVPSRAFTDTSVWTDFTNARSRDLLIAGTLEGDRYRLEARTDAPRPSRPGDTRHLITLNRLGDHDYSWDTLVEFAIGTITAEQIGNLAQVLLASPVDRPEHELRGDYRTAAPRATAALGRLFSLDTIRSTPLRDGTTAVFLSVRMEPERLKARFPALTRYLIKIWDPPRYRISLTDRSGATWFSINAAKRQIEVRYRMAQGHLAPLSGPPVARPDTLDLRIEATTKLKVFTVGLRDLVAEFVVSSSAHERAWTIHARREPKWDLPLVTERLLRAPLRRPFEGDGIVFSLGVRDSAGAQSLLTRRAHLAVRESAILRFLGMLGSHAVNEFTTETELEQDVFMRELFAALHADIRALGATPEEQGPENEKRR
jgi:hypothetical protein